MREVLQTRNRAFGPNGVPTTSRQTSATRTDTTSRLPISLGSTNKMLAEPVYTKWVKACRRGAQRQIKSASRWSCRGGSGSESLHGLPNYSKLRVRFGRELKKKLT